MSEEVILKVDGSEAMGMSRYAKRIYELWEKDGYKLQVYDGRGKKKCIKKYY